ncbi:spondin domain-containing protein [Methylomonas sp. AM2-LC]|uniref:spondin domain-containing protein n=1 Tax=Methylomonas sp. AM2-LC TaxID=3153301 RepID=UPI003264D36E
MRFLPVILLTTAFVPFASVQAQEVTLSFANLSASNGAALSPIFVALTDGSTSAFTPGGTASAAITKLAETGSGSDLFNVFGSANGVQTAEVTASSNAFGPGIYLPGATGSITLDLDPNENKYLSFFSMVVPSNDRFIGGEIQLFNNQGQFIAGNTVIDGNAIWDAGAVKSQVAGAAFLTAGGTNTPISNGVITANDNFSVWSGQKTADGYNFTSLPGDNTPLLSITTSAVPEPSIAWLFTSALWMLAVVRGKTKKLTFLA